MSHICSEVLPLIDRFLDGELPAALQSAVSSHLQRCAKCRAEADLKRVVKDSVARSCQEQAPPTLREAVYRRLVQTEVAWVDGQLVQRTLRVEYLD